MANVANTKNTGPTSDRAVSGGTTFPIKEKVGPGTGGNWTLSTGSEEARRTIMGMRVQSTDFASRDAQAALKGKTSVGISTGGNFSPTK